MPPLEYHSGQLAIQKEASTVQVADQLAHWVGPVGEFARGADLIFFVSCDSDTTLGFTTLSGASPLVETINGPEGLRVRLPPGITHHLAAPTFLGGLVISLSNARRARINGRLLQNGEHTELETTETFTLCKKYIAPSLALKEEFHTGPISREPLAIDDPWLARLIAQAETGFLATLSPAGRPDVAHRGGPAGFFKLDPAAGVLAWNEFVGDGIFKSAGNLRSTAVMTMLVPDFETGDGVELVGQGRYQNLRFDPKPRRDPLVQHKERYPVQGLITCEVHKVFRLKGLLIPRRRIEHALKITSRDTPN